MSTGKKILLAVPGIPLILILFVALIWDPNWFKSSVTPHIENVENHTIEFDSIEHSLFSPGEIIIRDIAIRGPVASGKVDSLVLSVDVMKAIDRDILIREVTLQQPDLEIDMEALNAWLAQPGAETTETPPAESPTLPINSVFVAKAAMLNANIKDISSLQQFSVQGLNLNLSDIDVVQNSKVVLLQENAPLNARLDIRSLAAQSIYLGTLQSQISASKESVTIEKLNLNTDKSALNISASAKNLADTADINLNISSANLHLEEFQSLLKDSPIIPSGNAEVSGSLTTTGQLSDVDALLQGLSGDIALTLEQGKLQGVDVNAVVTAFKDSKETDLKDIGSFVLTGPLGILAANMLDLGSGSKAMEGETLIPQLKMHAAIDKGNINLSNSAVATDQYRLAFTGGINPFASTFDDFTFAVLNDDGCARLTQVLNGDMAQPTSAVAKSLLDSAIAPISGLFKSVQNTMSDCQPFYEGDVAHPTVPD